MALQTGINPCENLVYNGDFSTVNENHQILMPPLMLYPQNIQNNCAMVLHPINNANNQNLKIPEIIFDGNCFQFQNVEEGSIQNDYVLPENLQYVDEGQQVDDGLSVLEIICGNKSDLGQPEFIDINQLSEADPFENTKNVDVLYVSDDDDVVFVKAYKEDKSGPKVEDTADHIKEVEDTKVDDCVLSQDDKPRRNPVRKVRINSKKLSREHILEEDFALLDASDDERRVGKENKPPNRKSSQPTEPLKQWPVNAHERPEYNTETKKIEAFDYTIREIQKKAPNRKPRLETVPVKSKSKKKYYTRKRKPRVVAPNKVPISELQTLVNSTTDMMKDFFISCKESRKMINSENINSEICSFENRFEVFRNQIILASVVNGMDQQEVSRKLEGGSFLVEEAKE